MTTETYIRQQDGEVDAQEELNEPPIISYLRSDHCIGAEDAALPGGKENGWMPKFTLS